VLFDRADAARRAATVKLDTLKEFDDFFGKDEESTTKGGLAYCNFVDSPEMNDKLKSLKATIRCVPLDAPDEPGKCIFTGQPSTRRGVFARAY
jgi:prolyl-tRNA synthetase